MIIKKFMEKKRDYCRHPKGDVIDLPSKLVDIALCTCFNGDVWTTGDVKKTADMKLEDCECCKYKGKCKCCKCKGECYCGKEKCNGKQPRWNYSSFKF